MQVDEGYFAGPLGVAVSHPQGARLLQAQHVAEVLGEVTQERQLGRSRVAEDGRYPELAQKIERCLAYRRHRVPLLLPIIPLLPLRPGNIPEGSTQARRLDLCTAATSRGRTPKSRRRARSKIPDLSLPQPSSSRAVAGPPQGL